MKAILVLSLALSVCMANKHTLNPTVSYEDYVANGGLPMPEKLQTSNRAAWYNESRSSTYIVGGTAATAGQFPWIVSLAVTSHFCGGSLITSKTVLTAAHCASGQTASKLKVRMGTLTHASGGTQLGVSQIKIHSNYNPSTIDYDVALVILASAAPIGGNIQTVALASSEPASGATVVAAGWGTTSQGAGSIPASLRWVAVPIVARATCESNYGSSSITARMICAGVTGGGKDSCQGDSGGPLTSGSTQVGIVSWGSGCAQPGKPGVYTNVANLLPWINGNKALSTSASEDSDDSSDSRIWVSYTEYVRNGGLPMPEKLKVGDYYNQSRSSTYIVGGTLASTGEFPWMGALCRSGSQICGCSLITPTTVLTAAHCVSGENYSKFTVRLGSNNRESGGTLYKVTGYRIHESYNSATYDNDLALLYLANSAPIGTKNIDVVGLATSEPSAGAALVCSGWGTTSQDGAASTSLRKVTINYIARSTCQDMYGSSDSITDRMICAGVTGGGKDSCQGDSGGPLTIGSKLYGTVSWGRGCADANYPGVYASVAKLVTWINGNKAKSLDEDGSTNHSIKYEDYVSRGGLPLPEELKKGEYWYKESRASTYIIGGTAAKPGEFPSTVSLAFKGQHFCGGSIISCNTVLTAAHCMEGTTANQLKHITVRAGSNKHASGGTLLKVCKYTYHSHYNPSTIDYDVALVYTCDEIPLGKKNIHTIKLAKSEPKAGTKLVCAGWGTTNQYIPSFPDKLQKVTVEYVSRTCCRWAYGFSWITDRMLCAGVPGGGKDSCWGDSGGPLIWDKSIVGIVSWGEGCAEEKYPGVYTSVPSLREWINANKE